MRKILIFAAAAAASAVFVAAPAAQASPRQWPGVSASGTLRDLAGTPLATFEFDHMDDSMTVCDLLDDGREAHGRVNSIERGTGKSTLEFTAVDRVADGECVTQTKDLPEGTLLTVGARMLFPDGSSASFTAGDWAIA